MPNLSFNTFLQKNPLLNKLVFNIFCLLLIMIFCLFFNGCGLFYYNTSGAEGQNSSTFSKNSNNIGNTGNSDKDNNGGNSGNSGSANGSSDDKDKTSPADSSQNGTTGQDLQSKPSLDLYTVSRVIDGDTFSVAGGGMVRMMGINTPEVDQYFYEEAKEVLSMMIDKTIVSLERDMSDTDKYGRLLRYVFAGELFVNLEMVKRGFANIFTVPPDIKYADELLEAERYARENNLGLWEISAGYIGENIKEDKENKAGSNTGQSGAELKTISVELVWDAPGSDMENLNGEYADIKNESAYDIDIGGWTVKDSATKIYEFKHYILKSGEKIFLFSGSGTDSGGRFYWNNSQPVWNNDHDTLYLRDKEGMLVEIYNY
jgi:endonuclease YncB( thermonuclease family)